VTEPGRASFRTNRVVAPGGAECQVGRRWITRKVRPSWKGRQDTAGELLASALPGDIPGESLGDAILEWSVPGWRLSGKVIDAVTEDLAGVAHS
jgi:hypothetical protein